MVLMLESDAWRNSGSRCFITVEKVDDTSPEPANFTIGIREVSEREILPEEVLARKLIMTRVFQEIECSAISHRERRRLQVEGQTSYTYGEIDPTHFIPVLGLLDMRADEEFWDLGCGAGKVLVTVSLAFPWLKRITGVEYLEGLAGAARQAVGRFHELINENEEDREKLQVVCGDMREIDWSGADIVYASSLCFSSELVEAIHEKMLLLKVGSRIVTLKIIPDKTNFLLLHTLRVKMTWGCWWKLPSA